MSAPLQRQASIRGSSSTGECGYAATSRSAVGCGSRPAVRSKSRSQTADSEVVETVQTEGRQRGRLGCRRGLAQPAVVLALAWMLAGCSSSLLSIGPPPGLLPSASTPAQPSPQATATLPKEHQ